MNKSEMLERLVENAFDFLRKSISEIEQYPKFSVIHFHAAVELFLKARLMEEHWSLVISHAQKPDWDKFISGNFQSISLEGAAERLEKIVRSGLTKQELKSFRDVTKHRNKVVHFFHEAHSDEENKEQVQEIVKQQLSAWYLLHNLLKTRWKSVFLRWGHEIATIDYQLRYLHTFLQVVYEQELASIVKLKQKGVKFAQCPSCNFESLRMDEPSGLTSESNCLVCRLTEKSLIVTCPDCDESVKFVNEGFGECENCGKSFEPDDLAELLTDSAAVHIAAMDGDDSWDAGNCSWCDGYETVVRTEDDTYICASCFHISDNIQRCGWCNSPNNGDMEHSYAAGCNHCEGRAGWDD